MRKKNSQVCDGIFDVSSPPFTGKERKNRITDAKIFEKIRIANTKWHIFSPSLSPSIRVYFRKKTGAISAIQAGKHANHCVSEARRKLTRG